jgi:hypothetical protein
MSSTQGIGAIHAKNQKSGGGKAAQSSAAPKKAYLNVKVLIIFKHENTKVRNSEREAP